ncbi:hypothetical protein [Streptomyces sp. NBC_01565]|uniref:hypothetical protein n=1 Tax=Streptomyces sp. NBC_01565 TaxID=2975881 RepID=UPI00224E1E54|nr:hypothetical protein [Streptomyces sp. NBC_01565]MCX4543764.1 hypothetical protein [Streptomyces sp. NBC_01565]
MATSDASGQGILLPRLTDAPNIDAHYTALEAMIRQTVLTFASAATRNAVLTSPVEGQMVWLQDSNTFTVYDGTTWQGVPTGGTWQNYTPSWTAVTTNPVLGNGSLSGRYMRDGSTVNFSIKITAGSTTTFGSGPWSLTLPTAAANNIDMLGKTFVGDSSAGTAAYSQGPAYIAAGGTTVSPYAGGANSTGIVSSLNPQTWANGDRLWISGTYEAA